MAPHVTGPPGPPLSNSRPESWIVTAKKIPQCLLPINCRSEVKPILRMLRTLTLPPTNLAFLGGNLEDQLDLKGIPPVRCGNVARVDMSCLRRLLVPRPPKQRKKTHTHKKKKNKKTKTQTQHTTHKHNTRAHPRARARSEAQVIGHHVVGVGGKDLPTPHRFGSTPKTEPAKCASSPERPPRVLGQKPPFKGVPCLWG